MTTDKQAAANRRNAESSTGPTSHQGRERSKMNALTHGLAAETMIIGAERAEDYESFRKEMFDALGPVGVLECTLVDRLVFCGWRLQRAARKEAGLERGKQMRAKREYENEMAAQKEGRLWSSTGVADPREREDSLSGDQIELLRYETAIERSFYRAMHNLERVQARRLGRHVTVPIAVDLGIQQNPDPP